MSYGFNMYFAKADSMQEALFLANQFVKTVCTPERMQDLITQDPFYVPSVHYCVHPEERKFSRLADKYWLYSLFNYRFVYWEKFRLLGFVSDGNIKDDWMKVFGMRGVCSVYFQNSTDQDYTMDEWPTSIPYFKKRCQKYKKLAEKDYTSVIKYLRTQGEYVYAESEDMSDEDAKDAFDYIIDTALYSHIFNELELSTWLYGNDSPYFERFAINGMKTSETVMDLSETVNRYVNETCDNIDRKTVTIAPVFIEGETQTLKIFKYIHDRHDKDVDVRAVIDEVIQEYLNSREGKEISEKFSGNSEVLKYSFLLSIIPDMYFRSHGLFPVRKGQYAAPVVFEPSENIRMKKTDE